MSSKPYKGTITAKGREIAVVSYGICELLRCFDKDIGKPEMADIAMELKSLYPKRLLSRMNSIRFSKESHFVCYYV